MVVPSQYGPALEAVGVGNGFTTTDTVPVPVQPDASVTVAEYVPLAAVVTDVMLGFCKDDVNPFGPVQLQVTPLLQVKLRVVPAQTGELLDRPGISAELTVTEVVAVAVQLLSVTVTVYTPCMAVVAAPTDGFCEVDVNALGPLHEYVPPPVALN
jgi:hypothetical protein